MVEANVDGINENEIIESAITAAEEVKTRLASDPDAVRKILTDSLDVTDTVTVYPNKRVNLAFEKHNQALRSLKDESDLKPGETDKEYNARIKTLKPRLEALETEGAELRQAIEDSAVTFEFRGLGKRAIKRIRNDVRKDYPLPPEGVADDPTVKEERDDVYQERVIAAHIQHAGYTAEDVADFRDKWPSIEFGKLWATALKLSITDDYLHGAIDADF
jgi:hypothetical protein